MSETDDLTAINQLILHERQGRDRGWWQQMSNGFAHDSQVRLSWYQGDGAGFVRGSQQMSESGDLAVHRLTPPIVHLQQNRAVAEVACAIEFQVQIDQIPAHLISYTRLNYRLVREGAQWWIVRLDAIYERDTLTPASPGDRIDITHQDVVGQRRSYALLSYYLARKGYDVRDDLLGDDQPEQVATFYAELHQWLAT